MLIIYSILLFVKVIAESVNDELFLFSFLLTILCSVSKRYFGIPFPDSKSLFFTSSESRLSSNDHINLNGFKNKDPPNCAILDS